MPSSNVEQIKERLDIVDVISQYIKVEKAGINFKAKCPFHNEKTPSFFISPSRQSFYCFGCGEKGDIFSFVEKFEGLDFRGALESLARKAGIEIKKFEKGERPDSKDRLFEIMRKAAEIYQKNLEKNKEAADYLNKRGLSDSSVSKWRIGFAPDEWRTLHDELIRLGFTKEEMLQAGLVKKVENESKYYDTFRNRIMFPINDSAGRVIAFSGRAMKEGEKNPKYLNSPETKLFYKSEVLYGFDIAKNSIRKLDYAVLVEGQLDLIMSHQAGIANTVASSGTALTLRHLQKIQKLSNRVIIAYDSDSAGENAAKKAAMMALSLAMEAKVASLPEGEDPASVVKDNPQKWKDALKESGHFTDYAIEKAAENFKDRNLTREIIKNVLPLAHLIKSEIEKTQFVKKIALKTKASEEAVWSDLKKATAPGTAENPVNGEWRSSRKERAMGLKQMLAVVVLLDESTGTKPSKIRVKWEEISGKERVDEILSEFEENKETLFFEAERRGVQNSENQAEDLLRRIEIEELKLSLQATATVLDGNKLSKEEEKEVKLKFSEIQKRIRELNS